MFYTQDHEWINNKDNKVGITQHAQELLGDIVYVELPEVGDEFNIGDEFGSIESVKAVSSLFMPVSGTIVEINTVLEDTPEIVNSDPYVGGWIIKIEMSNVDELQLLLSLEQYIESIT